MLRNKLIVFLWGGLFFFAALILLLSYQNIQLKKAVGVEPFDALQMAKIRAKTFETQLESLYLFRKLQIDFNVNNLTYSSFNNTDVVNGYVFAVFDLTVCGKCLRSEMQVLKSFMESLAKKNISVIAIIGVADKNEESDIVDLRQSGYLFYPCHIMQADEIYRKFNLNKNVFLDTPFYIFANHEFAVLDIFKPIQETEEDFIQWLKILINQELY